MHTHTIHFKDTADDEKVQKLLDFVRSLDFVLAVEPVQTRPYRAIQLHVADALYLLAQHIEARVSWDEGQYFIEFDPLGISVWGESRAQAEEAFAFAFHALYLNYALESDEKLTGKARAIKSKLLSLIKNVVHEAPQVQRH